MRRLSPSLKPPGLHVFDVHSLQSCTVLAPSRFSCPNGTRSGDASSRPRPLTGRQLPRALASTHWAADWFPHRRRDLVDTGAALGELATGRFAVRVQDLFDLESFQLEASRCLDRFQSTVPSLAPAPQAGCQGAILFAWPPGTLGPIRFTTDIASGLAGVLHSILTTFRVLGRRGLPSGQGTVPGATSGA